MSDLLKFLSPRVDRRSVRRKVREARLTLRTEIQACTPYLEGTYLELQSRQNRIQTALKSSIATARQAYFSRQGRQIDLAALLSERRNDGNPVWALKDPCSCNPWNGKRDSDGTLNIGSTWVKGIIPKGETPLLPAGGIPPLPARAREIVTNRTIRRRALWVGLLYQPDEWLLAKPDPAIVVEWNALPGQFYTLCVWGTDRGRIMEFVS